MNKEESILCYDLNIFIVKMGMGSKVLSQAKKSGLTGGTVIIGKGTIKNPILKFLELAENHKEIVLILGPQEKSIEFIEKASKHFNFIKPNNGIAFSMSVISIVGAKNSIGDKENICESKGDNMHNSIFAIVERGTAQKVVDAANEAGARGGTIINARGSGIHETSKIFSIDIEPEKEIVLILVENEITDKVCDRIREKTEIDKAGKGILFVQNVNKAYGLFKK
ncbi:nitrogen regulatory protein P-II family [Natranaerovirga hydrolytica]|uniref:Nitrogen regulatory protein P-II family n=1 Tax=Natranaerovirga hydrolytica TaxID=680378 RepID=A0A4R1MRX5_9FIRM|nr:P-II family nitrogen regulator [Natranaerovirga hydrolytica]TCK93319.1 nitrogen regulatory protein P-II family [Natranaerovirga hydrolytica]